MTLQGIEFNSASFREDDVKFKPAGKLRYLAVHRRGDDPAEGDVLVLSSRALSLPASTHELTSPAN